MSDGVQAEAVRNLREAAKRAVEVGVAPSQLTLVVDDARREVAAEHSPVEHALNLGSAA